METKQCTKCKETKLATLEYFGRNKNGFLSWCKECYKKDHEEHKIERNKIKRQKYRDKHPKEEIQEGYKKCTKCGKIKSSECFNKSSHSKIGLKPSCKECRKKEYIENSQRNIEKSRKYYENNKREISIKNKIYKEKHKEWYSEYMKEYYKDNKIAIIENVKTNMYARLKIDVNYKLLVRYRTRLYKAVKGYDKSKTTRELIGCSVEELKKHLESQFTEGMTFENYGEWHVDHIIPCSSFDFSKEEEQRKCFNYKNLQPLWAIDNLRKSNKII